VFNMPTKAIVDECLKEMVLASRREDDLDDAQRDTMLLLWDMERAQLHGVFQRAPSQRNSSGKTPPGMNCCVSTREKQHSHLLRLLP
jgi:hypothetical protein